MPTPNWLRASLLEMSRHQPLCDLYESIYEGTIQEQFSNPVVADRLRNSPYYRVNFSRTVVDAPLERLKISGIVCADPRGRTVLEDFWTVNEMDFSCHDTHEKALEFGHSAVILMPDEDGVLRAYGHDPRSVMVFYDVRRPNVKSHAIHSYIATDGDGDEFTQFDQSLYFWVEVYTPTSMQRWRSTVSLPDGMNVDPGSVDMVMVDEVKNAVPGRLPVFHYRTSRSPYGRSRLVDVVGAQTAINDVMTAMMASVKEAGYRQRWLTSDKAEAGRDNFSPGSSSGESDGTVAEGQFEAGPDTILTFEGQNVKVGSFDVTQSSNFLEPIRDLRAWLYEQADIPTHYFSTGKDAPSGESFRQGERPLLAVVEHIQSLFGSEHKELLEYVLAYHGITADAEVSWATPVANDADWWGVAKLKTGLGVPRKVVLVEAGYSQEVVDEWDEDEERDSSNTPPPDDETVDAENRPIDPPLPEAA